MRSQAFPLRPLKARLRPPETIGAPGAERRRPVTVASLLRAESDPRLRADAHRRLRAASRHLRMLVVIATGIDLAWVLPDHPTHAAAIVGANLLALGAAFAGAWLVTIRPRHVELVILAVLGAVDASLAVVIGTDRELSLIAAGYALVLPPLVALLVPWRSWIHLSWLLAHALAVILAVKLAPNPGAVETGPRTIVVLLAISSAASLFGHLADLRARVALFRQLSQIRALHRDAVAARARLETLNGLLERVAATDQLTGLGNRVALHAYLASLARTVDRRRDRFALLVLDLDRFKGINDSLGHFAGDGVLRAVSAAIAAAVREGDGVFRFGGEEFLVIARLRPGERGRAIAERLRAAVESLAVAHPANAPFRVVTTSVGGCIIGRGARLRSVDTELRRADAALYQAKRAGRNRVCISGERAPLPI